MSVVVQPNHSRFVEAVLKVGHEVGLQPRVMLLELNSCVFWVLIVLLLAETFR